MQLVGKPRLWALVADRVLARQPRLSAASSQDSMDGNLMRPERLGDRPLTRACLGGAHDRLFQPDTGLGQLETRSAQLDVEPVALIQVAAEQVNLDQAARADLQARAFLDSVSRPLDIASRAMR